MDLIIASFHALEREYHGSEWSAEEDALAFLMDAGLVGRLVMDNQGRWPDQESERLPMKIGECVWWPAVLTERTGMDFVDCMEEFLNRKKEELR